MKKAAIYLLLGCLLQSCWPNPGRGKRARSGYRFSAIIVNELEGYHSANGQYPDALAMLNNDSLRQHFMPKYISTIAYKVQDSGRYELTFMYAGPGMNWCTYQSATKKWKCGGYY